MEKWIIGGTHLLHAPDELIAAVLGELLVEKLLGAINRNGSAFFVLLGNTGGEVLGLLLGRDVSRRILGLLRQLLLDSPLRLLDSQGGVIVIGGRRRRRRSGGRICSGAGWLGPARGSGLGGRRIGLFSALDGGLGFLVALLVGLAHERLCALLEGTAEAAPLEVDTRRNRRSLGAAFGVGTCPCVGRSGVVDLK